MVPFLSLVCVSSTLVSQNLGSGRPKEASCFTEQLGMDLGCPCLAGCQKVVFVGKRSRVTSIITLGNSLISQIRQHMGGFCPVCKSHEFRASCLIITDFPTVHV